MVYFSSVIISFVIFLSTDFCIVCDVINLHPVLRRHTCTLWWVLVNHSAHVRTDGEQKNAFTVVIYVLNFPVYLEDGCRNIAESIINLVVMEFCTFTGLLWTIWNICENITGFVIKFELC